MARRRSQQSAAAQPPVVDANVAGTMVLIAVLIPWHFEPPLNFDVTDREFNPLVFVPVVFAVIGLYSLRKAIRDTPRVRKFGATTLQAGPARPGGRFEGLVRSSRDLRPAATTPSFFVASALTASADRS